MSSRTPAPRTRLAAAVLVALGAVLATACTGETPVRDYGAPASDAKDYYDNFILGCTGVTVDPAGATPVRATAAYDDAELGSFDYCKCVYDGLEEKVPFDDSKQFEEAQATAEKGKDGTYDIEVPENIDAVYSGCRARQ